MYLKTDDRDDVFWVLQPRNEQVSKEVVYELEFEDIAVMRI